MDNSYIMINLLKNFKLKFFILGIIIIFLYSFLFLFLIKKTYGQSLTIVEQLSNYSTTSTGLIREIEDINKLQEMYKSTYGKYAHIPPYTFEDKIISLHEYQTSNKETGKQIIIESNDSIESIADGIESISRTYKILKQNNATTTNEIE